MEVTLQNLVYEIGKQKECPPCCRYLEGKFFWMLVCEFELPILSASSFTLSHDWKVICLLAGTLKVILIKISLKSRRKKEKYLLLLLGPYHFCSLLCPSLHEMFPWYLTFLKRSVVFPILLFSSTSLHYSLRKAFLSLLAVLWNSAFRWVYLFFSPLPCTSLLFWASSGKHFAYFQNHSFDYIDLCWQSDVSVFF